MARAAIRTVCRLAYLPLLFVCALLAGADPGPTALACTQNGAGDGNNGPGRAVGYLVISAPSLAGSAGLQSLIALRSAEGYDVTAVDTNITGQTATSIDAFITNAYMTWPVPPEFLLLVGDSDTIPHWTGTGMGAPPTDLYYADVDGDALPDIMTGRLPVRTATELDNLCAKIAAMENSPSRKAAFLAGAAGWQQTEPVHNLMVSIFLNPAGWTADKLYCYSYGATTADVFAAFNDGRAIGCFAGHGNRNGWIDGPAFSQADVRALTNTLPSFIVSFASWTGDYSAAECFGETWLRSSHGAAAFLGESSTPVTDLAAQFEFWLFDSLFSPPTARPLGEAVVQAQIKLHQTSTHSPPVVLGMIEMTNLLGDPAMKIPIGPVPPRPDIRVNGVDQALTISQGTPATVTISLDPGSAAGVPHDWWVSVNGPVPSALYWRTLTGWRYSLNPVRGFAGPLFPLSARPIGSSSSLPRGVYDFTFAVDAYNGIFEGTFSDFFTLTVN